MFSLDPSVVGLVSPCTCWRKDTITRLCASCHVIGEELVFFPFLYIKLFELDIMLFELGVEVALNHGSADTHNKVNLLKFQLQSSSFASECTDDAFVLLICFCFFHL